MRKGEIFMAKITADTLIVDCLKLNPDSAEILMGYGMHCLGCAMAHGETIGEAVSVHGKDLDELLEKLNVVGTPGSGFGAMGEGYFRLTAFGNREDTIAAMERFKKFF